MNAIKQRILPNNLDKTPKSDFNYIQGSRNTIYNKDVSVKYSDLATPHYSKKISVGMGQYVSFSVNSIDGLKIHLRNNIDDIEINNFIIDSSVTGISLNYASSKSIASFVGRPFSGDNNRYLVVNYKDIDGYYSPYLINIDTWTLVNLNFAGQSGITYDFIYNGVDGIYFTIDHSSPDIFKVNIDGSGYSALTLSDNTTRVQALNLYGMTDTKLYFKDINGIKTGYEFSTQELDSYWYPNNLLVYKNWTWYNTELGNIYIDNGIGNYWDISQAMSDNAMIGVGELLVVPVLITSFDESDTELKFTMLYVRQSSLSIGYGDFIINKSTSEISIPNSQWVDGIITESNWDIVNNSFSNSCNTYNDQIFYDYGLQKQWNLFITNILTKEERTNNV